MMDLRTTAPLHRWATAPPALGGALLLGALLTLGACVSGGLGEPTEEPGTNNDLPNNDTGNNLPSNNNTPADCSQGQGCAVGRFTCVGDNEIHVCRQLDGGCTAFVLNETCEQGRVCLDALCVEASGCLDRDGDGHGTNCPDGPDCDDQDPNRHQDRSELCDGTDNDCDGIEDEGNVCDADCSNQPCVPGDRECIDDSRAVECQPDNDGCGQWSQPFNCGAGSCVGGVCDSPDCVDNDGDGRGAGCAFGGDCDDNNPNRYEGAEELCDGLDNDCDGDPDEDFADFGQPCTTGTGACQATGTFRCAPGGRGLTCSANAQTPRDEVCGNNIDDNCNGQTDEGFDDVGDSCTAGRGACRRTGRIECDGTRTSCSASPGPSSEEICDNIDNDCDGQTDEGGVCTTCMEDAQEPDQSSSAGTTLARGASIQGTLCGTGNAGADWFKLGNYNAGQTITVRIEFTPSSPDTTMHMEIYRPDITFGGQSGFLEGNNTFTYTATQTGQHFLWVFPNTNPAPGIRYTLIHQ